MGGRAPSGATGLGVNADRLELLAVVEAQIEDVYRELDGQTKRMSQLQAQLDEVRALVRQLMGRSEMLRK